ncbi:Bax inhibitor-1/YccA family protein [Bacilliculturomica massiliensis]|uniref:Bax inhibitor-1/YccA family protein n=1 Tax=Bacilliculturomica massiliensis TaxID=1917867 RepID=UPI0010318771|nr:Bax inhibitor-1/YccA family protein [Bacilliculturomica massiliensis]
MDDLNEMKSDFIGGASYGQEIEPVGAYAAKTFGWMCLGLLTTFAVAMAMIFTGAIWAVFSVPAMPFILLIAELGVVIYLSARIGSMSVGKAKGLFFTYAVLNGIVFSTIFVAYGMWSVLLAFLSASLYFGVMAGVGYYTKVDLSGMRPILFSGLIFLVVVWFLSIFIGLGAFERIVCMIGVAVFLGFTAYDTQKIRAYHAAFSCDPEMAKKASIFSALQLYLDFINLFLYILRFMGKRN